MPFLILLTILGVWAYYALRDRPLSYYLCLFFLAIVLTALAETLGTLVLNRYAWRLGATQSFLQDRSLGSLVIGFCLDPLLGVMFAHYSNAWPVPKAAAAALLLSGFEIWLVRHGYIIYRGWHPLYSALAFFAFFMVMWWSASRPWPLPHWLHVYGFALFLLYFLDVCMQGVAGLWHFSVSQWNWERVFSLLVNAWAPSPFITAIAVTSLARRWWFWGAAVVAGLLGVELLLSATGLLLIGWVGLTAVTSGVAVTVWLTVRYSAWLAEHEPAKAPPPWEPPIELR